MTARRGVRPEGPLARGAAWLSVRDALPTALGAVLGHYATTGDLDLDAIALKSAVETTTEGIVDDLFASIEADLEAEFGEPVSFEYETKLTMPAELTLGDIYRRIRRRADSAVDPVTGEHRGPRARLPGPLGRPGDDPDEDAVDDVERAEELTALIVAALLDGDMRDARNDEEYGDFVVDRDLTDEERRRVARVAQERLREIVEERFADFPPGVREAYDRAVDLSEAHQDQDERFRELLARALDGDDAAPEAIRREYKFRDFADHHPFDESELAVPYLKTQYDRVGVIYDGMLDMYRAAGFEIGDAFEKAVVLAIVGAQVWLDDVDDYEADVAEGQLTPVTAEYVLAEDDAAAYRTVCAVAEQYFDLAREYAAAADSPLTGIAIEYIVRSGDPSVLPGHPG